MVEKQEAQQILEKMLGKGVSFRPDQWEAVDAVVNEHRKVLLVQKTGWGKSIVYFLCAYFLRKESKALVLLVSPLLSLMRNQIDMARRIGIIAETVNSTNPAEWEEILERTKNNEVDILLISPERLGNKGFLERFVSLNIGLLVVDEVHCISDWGHDFRPDYRRIVRIVSNLPKGAPLLGTTATANNRVVRDIEEQFGKDLLTIRGPLKRESLKLQAVKLADQSERLAWLAENLPNIPGSGIIYCLTKIDCERVARWLKDNSINASSYHAQMNNERKEELEKLLMKNEVKALVSTVALGMGYDKPDIGFVIHFQTPSSIVSYYQQIGRAGRSVDSAEVILLGGKEDDDIHYYFFESAFPERSIIEALVELIGQFPRSKVEIMRSVNAKLSEIDKCLKILEIDGVITKNGSKYIRTVNKWSPESERWKRITHQRIQEYNDVKALFDMKGCLMKYVVSKLDDNLSEDCGKCCNCAGDFRSRVANPQLVQKAAKFLKNRFVRIEPRKRFPHRFENMIQIPEHFRCEVGYSLSIYGDAGWGRMVKEDKYERGSFRSDLVAASKNLITDYWSPKPFPEIVVSVPSLRRPYLVSRFAGALAREIGLSYMADCVVKKKETQEQKAMKNSSMQFENVISAFDVSLDLGGKRVLLVDDLVDSRWTFTVIAYLLKKKNAGEIYPFALSASWEGGYDDDES
ncbi:MAG TPA: RecQ family ATP-dependent DNA helicase [Mesotoga infera]|uniref:DNA 3'-5' helicase n=1 Tax=Mesotoga infera TaxID=1236046 RepID=A0A7C1H9E4_9BACT|nr:RecQ family ATP-dependent DNA helicase [Mesotoga infera]